MRESWPSPFSQTVIDSSPAIVIWNLAVVGSVTLNVTWYRTAPMQQLPGRVALVWFESGAIHADPSAGVVQPPGRVVTIEAGPVAVSPATVFELMLQFASLPVGVFFAPVLGTATVLWA